MIYVRILIYSPLIEFIIGVILIFAYKAIVGQMNSLSLLAMIILALALSPRFELIETKLGQKLQIAGFPVVLMRSIKNFLNKKK